MASRDGLISPPAKYMKYSFALRAQSQLGLPLAERGRYTSISWNEVFSKPSFRHFRENMEFFPNLHAYVNRSQFQNLEMDNYCENILRKTRSNDEKLNKSQWR